MIKMHMIIRAIVYSDNKEDALEKGKEVINNMCDENGKFDYATFFDEGENGISGVSRWGEIPPVCEVTSEEGKKLIKEGFDATKGNFYDNMLKIRQTISKYKDLELFEEKVMDNKTQVVNALTNDKNKDYELHMFRYYCNCVGQYDGSEIFLYGNDGEGIRTSDQLKRTLEEYNEGKKVWVVCADVHM